MLQQLCTLLALSLMPLPGQTAQSRPCVDVLIPGGMPIKMEVHKDESESEILKYDINRIVSSDARRAKITIVMLDGNGMIKLRHPQVGGDLSDPMSIATADRTVSHIYLIVEWLETNQGKWVADTKSGQLDIESLIKPNAPALPKSRFIAKN